MADGRTHARIAGGVAVALSTAALPVAVYDEAMALAMLAGAVGGWLVTPDIDIPHRTHEETRIYRVSPVLGVIWQTYWTPYALIIPHRHWLSHAPGIGTALRMLYLFWWLLFVVSPDWQLVVIAWLAWCVQDIAHLAADGFRLRA